MSSSEGSQAGFRALRYRAPAILLLAIVLADWVQLADPDLWMHVHFGQIVLRSGSIIRHDIFSYSAPGAPWFNHEWLADVAFGWCYNVAGVVGLKLLKFLCASALMVLLAIGIGEQLADSTIETAILMLAAVGLAPQIQFRPQLFDYVFLAALLVMVGRDNRGRTVLVWLALPLMALWANLHGSFFVGVAVLGVYAIVAGLQDLLRGRGPRQLARLSALTAGALLATLINPFGIHAWYVALAKFREPIIAMNLNVEFQSLFSLVARKGLWAAVGCLPMLVTLAGIVAVLLTPRGDDSPLVAIAVLMTCASVCAIRNMAFGVIAWSAPLAYHLHLALGRSATSSSNRRGQVILGTGAAILAIVGGLFSPRLATLEPYPADAIAFMERHRLSGNILTEYAWGGYVIWHEAPRCRVFFDTFDERYPDSVQRAYVAFMSGGHDQAYTVMREYSHDYVLFRARSPEDHAMLSMAGWKLVYRDPVASLFAPGDSPVLRQHPFPVVSDATRASFFP